jgi:hypothetical protein
LYRYVEDEETESMKIQARAVVSNEYKLKIKPGSEPGKKGSETQNHR